MTKELTGDVAIVTGAAAGMGREHALLLGRLGARVVVTDLSPDVEETAAAIRREGGESIAVQADISDPATGQLLVDTALAEFGELQIVVSNAGILTRYSFAELTAEEFDRIMRINAYGAFSLLHAAWPVLVEQRYGRVVVVSSSSAFVSQPLIAHYAASKGALLGLAKTLAAEGAEHGVTVNVLAPGAFTGLSGATANEEMRRVQEIMMPASLVSPAVAWLVRRENELNGEIIEAAAGRVALDFVGSTRGYWKKDLTVDDVVAHADQVLDRDGFAVIADTGTLAVWMTRENTGWAQELGH